MTAQVNRKNLGKQFTCTDETRFIFHWHRPGEHLPVLIRHAGEVYKLTQEHIDAAQAQGHSKLIPIEVNETHKTLLIGHGMPNGKGAITVQVEEGTKLGLAASLGLYAVASAVSIYAVIEIAKVFA